jgi:hypothetical protein
MRPVSVACVLGVFLAASACGGGGDASPTSSSVSGASGSSASASVVPFERLLGFLPALPGWTRGNPQGETDTSEGVSRVQVDYEQAGGIGGLSIEIMDTMGNADILAPLQAFIKANRSETSVDGTATTITPVQIGGFPARQEWTSAEGANNGSLGILVAGRFTVHITGSSLSGNDVMTKAAEAIDLKALATLK